MASRFLQNRCGRFRSRGARGTFAAAQGVFFRIHNDPAPSRDRLPDPLPGARPYRYNAALGESQRLAFTQWVNAEALERWLQALPDSANSGDIYARLTEIRESAA